ncbi:MAG: hypothetical protein JST79_15515 [Acidobacteria bacterium]|nr:hypothetical protein [Acidobacteriota bacterium]
MAAGVDAVKAQLIRDFGAIEIHEYHDANTLDTVLDFDADKGLPYKVRVTREYDDDYASGQLNIPLDGLGATLRASASGKVRILRNGIISN